MTRSGASIRNLEIPELCFPVLLEMCMKTNYWFNRNRILSHLRRFMIVFVVAVSAVALALALATPAGAPPPAAQNLPPRGTNVNTSPPGFSLTIPDQGTIKVKTHFDPERNETK